MSETPTVIATYQRAGTLYRVMEREGQIAVAAIYAQPGSGYAYTIERAPQTYATLAAAQAAADAEMSAKLSGG